MSIAPPPSNSSASSTTYTAPTNTTSKVLEGHEPNIPGTVSDKYREGLEDPSKRPRENINAQEDLIASLPRKDVSFGAQAALDRDRVPLVKRTEVHAVPAETSTENLLKDKQIEVSDVQIPPTTSQSKQSQPQDMLSKISQPSKRDTTDDSSTLSKQDQQWSESAQRHQENISSDSDSKPIESKPASDLSSNETSTLNSKFTEQLSDQDKQLEESAKQHQEKVNEKKQDKEIIPLEEDGSFQAQGETTGESIKDKLIDTKDALLSAFKQSDSKQDDESTPSVTLAERVENLKLSAQDKLAQAKDAVENTWNKSNKEEEEVSEPSLTVKAQTQYLAAKDAIKSESEKLAQNIKEKAMAAKEAVANTLSNSKVEEEEPEPSLKEKAEIKYLGAKDAIKSESEKLPENIKEKAMAAKDAVANTLSKSKEQEEEPEPSLREKAEIKYLGAKDAIKSESEKLPENIKEKAMEVKDSVQNTLSKFQPTKTSTAKIWEEQHIEPFDIPRTSTETQETRENPEATSSDSVLPTDQYDVKLASDESSISKDKNIEPEPKQYFPTDTIASLVRTVTHDLPERAKGLLFNKRDESTSSDSVLPTDQYDLQMDKQRESTKLEDTTKSTEEKVLEEKHVEPFDDHKTEPKHHFIQDKISNLVHAMTNLPARAKEFITKHEEHKSEPSSPREIPTIQERSEKPSQQQQQSSSLVKQREFSPEEVSFF